ncbi:phosphopantetheine-binding protein [Streptomyces sp. NPDC059161]|uniref:thioesterase domain-containing protein n=1 Tax=Streptomyces sp. NPDC059161 TaxID=3346749 RepID=UPI00369F3530
MTLAQLWAEVLGTEVPDRTTRFFDLGGNSLLVSLLWARLTDRFDLPLAASDLYEYATVAAQAEQIRGWFSGDGRGALAVELSDGPEPVVACVHGMSGNVYYARHLGNAVKQRVIGLRAVGFEGEHDPLTSVEEMAAAYLSALEAQGAVGGLCLVGYCGASLVAVEMARQCRSAGRRTTLVLVDPELWGEEARPAGLDELYREQLAFVAHRAGLTEWDDPAPLPRARGQLFRRLQLMGFYPRAFTEQQFDRQLRVSGEAAHALARYRPQPRLEVDAHLIFTQERLDEQFGGDLEAVRGPWASLLGGLTLQRVPTAHLEVFEQGAAPGMVGAVVDAFAARR